MFASPFETSLEDFLIHKQVLQKVVFGIRARFSAQFQFKHFLRLPRCLVKCSRENEPATRAQFPATRAQFQKVCKAKAPPRNLCGMCLHFHFSRTYLPRKLEQAFVYQWVLQEPINWANDIEPQIAVDEGNGGLGDCNSRLRGMPSEELASSRVLCAALG